MKSSIIFAVLSVCAISTAFSQSPIGKGGKQLNFGVGLYSGAIPVYVGMDFGVHPDITLGPQVGFDLNLEYLSVAGRGDYHFNTILDIPSNWDFYAGLNIGFIAYFEDNIDDDHHHGNRRHSHNHSSGVDLGLQIGGRYYWSDWGINLEFGGGNNLSGARFGLSKRF